MKRVLTLPIIVARCDPVTACPQSCRCARYQDEDDDPKLAFIDAAAARDPKGCGLFLDARAAALFPCLEQANGL